VGPGSSQRLDPEHDMTRTLKLVCGSSSVDLIAPSGIILMREVKGPTLSEDNLNGDAQSVSETFRLNLLGTSSDDAATKVQAMINMLRNIKRFREKKSYTPVYLQEQITGETNPRYAQVYSCYQFDHPFSLRTPLELDHIIENFGFTLTREHPWGSVIPGTQPANPLTLAPNDGPAAPTMVHVGNFCDDVALTHLYNASEDVPSPIFDTEAHAIAASGNNTVNITVANHTNKALFILVYTQYGSGPPSVAVTVGGSAATLVQNFGSYLWAGCDTFQLWRFVAPANGSNAVVAAISTNTLSVMSVLSYYNVDQTTPVGTPIYHNYAGTPYADTVSGSVHTTTLDGLMTYIGSSYTITPDGSQTQRLNLSVPPTSYVKMGISDKPGAASVTMQWTSDVSGAGMHFAISINPSAGITTFSANFYTSTGFALWPATPDANDWVLIGSTTAPWHNFVINLKTAAVINADLQIEIWNGSTWVALTQGTQYSIYPSGAAGAASGIFNATGDWVININPPTTWAAYALNSVTAWWLRIRTNAITTWTTSPVNSDTQVPYFLKNNWVEIPAAASAGDAPPIGIIRLAAPLGAGTTPCFAATSLILMGARDAGLTKFVSDLNPGGSGNPAEWAAAYGTDSSSVADVNAPRGKQCAVSFATNAASVVRASLTGTGMLAYWYGAFRVFLAVQQIGGANNDTRVKLRICIGSSADSDPKMDTKSVKLQTHDAGYEVVDLGLIKIPFGENAAADSLAADLIFQIMAERLTGASTLKIASLILLPVDLWYCQLEDPKTNIALGSSALRGNSVLDLDGGVMDWRCSKFVKVGGNLIPAENWLAKGRALNVEPATKTRVYFMMMHFPATWGTGPMLLTTGMMLAAQVYAKNRYSILRGAA
jgi:hypothetical protein